MAVTVTHSAVVATPDDGTSEVGSDEWNAAHVVTGAYERELLTANRTYYVRTDGSNSNDGLANTAGGAWLTIQHAIDVVAATIDFSKSYWVTIQIADGTYDEQLYLKPLIGAGDGYFTNSAIGNPGGFVYIVGNQADLTLVNIAPSTSPSAPHAVINADTIGPGWNFWYVHFNSVTGWHAVQINDSKVIFNNCQFSRRGTFFWLISIFNSVVSFNVCNYNVSTDLADTHDLVFNIDFGSQVTCHGNFTLVGSDVPEFTTGIFDLDLDSFLYLNGVNFIGGWGALPGKQFTLVRGSAITMLSGDGAIPGAIAGTYDETSWISYAFGNLNPGYRKKLSADTTYYVRTGRGAVTISIATPAVVTLNGHGIPVGGAVIFTTTGALPTGISAGTIYYVISAGYSASTFQFSTSVGGAAVNTSGTQSGTQYIQSGNNNSGLGSSDNGWLTLQYAINYIHHNIDLNGWTATIQLTDSVYDEQILLKPVVGVGGHFGTYDTADAGQIYILGNSTTHSETTIKSTSVGFENRLVYANNVNGYEFWYCTFDGTDATFAGGSVDALIGLENSRVSFVECDLSIDGSTNKKVIFDLFASYGRFNDLNFNTDNTIDSVFRLNRISSPYSTGAMTLLTGTPVLTNGFYDMDNSTFRLESVSYVDWGTISCVPYTLSDGADLNTIFTSGFPGTLLPYIDTTSRFNSRHGWVSPLETQAVSSSLGFTTETTTSNREIGGVIASVNTDATDGSEDFYWSFRTMNAGAAAAEIGRLEKTAVAGDTALMLYDVDNNTVERVTVGIDNSGGIGFKVLRIPN